jgi:hypothetical protein
MSRLVWASTTWLPNELDAAAGIPMGVQALGELAIGRGDLGTARTRG